MELVILLFILIYIAIVVLISAKFASIASDKGHDGYFIVCLLLGIIGYIMVAALPDEYCRRAASERNDGSSSIPGTSNSKLSLKQVLNSANNKSSNNTRSNNSTMKDNNWKCKHCGTINPQTNTSCPSCGNYR